MVQSRGGRAFVQHRGGGATLVLSKQYTTPSCKSFANARFAEYRRQLTMVTVLFKREKATPQQALRTMLRATRAAAKPGVPFADRGGDGASGGTDEISLAQRWLCSR